MNPTDDDLQTLVVPMYGASNRDQLIDDMTLVRDERDHLNTRPAPRVPRQTEPCPLWQFGLIAGLLLLALGVAGAGLIYGLGLTLEAFDSYATAFLRGLVRWAQ